MKNKLLRAFTRLKNHPQHWKRVTIGVLLIIGGLVGPFVPILGLWMLPLGIVLVSTNTAWYQRWRQRYRNRRR